MCVIYVNMNMVKSTSVRQYVFILKSKEYLLGHLDDVFFFFSFVDYLPNLLVLYHLLTPSFLYIDHLERNEFNSLRRKKKRNT